MNRNQFVAGRETVYKPLILYHIVSFHLSDFARCVANLREDFLRVLPEFRGRSPAGSRGIAKIPREARHLRLAVYRMVQIHEIVVGQRLGVVRDFRRRLHWRANATRTPQNVQPLNPRLLGKSFIKDGYQFFGILAPGLYGVEPGIMRQSFQIECLADFRPIAVGLQMGNGYPLVVLTSVVVIDGVACLRSDLSRKFLRP